MRRKTEGGCPKTDHGNSVGGLCKSHGLNRSPAKIPKRYMAVFLGYMQDKEVERNVRLDSQITI